MTGKKRKRATIITALIFSFIIAGICTGLLLLLVTLPVGTVAPAAGISAVTVFVLSYLYFTRRLRRRKRILSQPFPDRWNLYLEGYLPLYNALDEEEREIFRRRVQLFLAEKTITGIKTNVDEETRVLIAASAILPVFRLPEWEYDFLGEVLVYPDNFDDSFATDGQNRDVLGMVMTGTSSLIISKPALYAGFQDMSDGQNTGIHEFIHKIDEEDGEIDGVPALLMDRARIREWHEIMEHEMKKIEGGSSDIDPYALTSPAEFFAVTAEYFFEKPDEMAQRHPRLYEIFATIFAQDLRSILKSVTTQMLTRRPKKTGRNDPCPCGSGKKYKHCCMNKKTARRRFFNAVSRRS